MAKRRKGHRSSKCPEPINTMLDLAGALTLGLYTKHKIKKDFEKGEGIESAKAAGMVFGIGSMRSGSRGIINLGGLLGLNSALKDIEKKENARYISSSPSYVNKVMDTPKETPPKVRKYLWRSHCEDGSPYGIIPYDYETADEYNDALDEAKVRHTKSTNSAHTAEQTASDDHQVTSKKYVWRKYCEDGSDYGISPNDYETADDYEEALLAAKESK